MCEWFWPNCPSKLHTHVTSLKPLMPFQKESTPAQACSSSHFSGEQELGSAADPQSRPLWSTEASGYCSSSPRKRGGGKEVVYHISSWYIMINLRNGPNCVVYYFHCDCLKHVKPVLFSDSLNLRNTLKHLDRPGMQDLAVSHSCCLPYCPSWMCIE